MPVRSPKLCTKDDLVPPQNVFDFQTVAVYPSPSQSRIATVGANQFVGWSGISKVDLFEGSS